MGPLGPTEREVLTMWAIGSLAAVLLLSMAVCTAADMCQPENKPPKAARHGF